jgi:hypothetical protein
MADEDSDVSTPAGLARTWVRAIRWRWLAAASAATTLFVLVQLLRLLYTPLESVSIVTSLLLLFGMPTLIATLPATTVRWRVSALLVGIHVGAILNSPVESLSLADVRDSFAAAFDDDGRGVLTMFVCALISLPLLEMIGARVRREALASEAKIKRPA